MSKTVSFLAIARVMCGWKFHIHSIIVIVSVNGLTYTSANGIDLTYPPLISPALLPGDVLAVRPGGGGAVRGALRLARVGVRHLCLVHLQDQCLR